MKTSFGVILIFAFSAAPAPAHFLWIVPDPADSSKASVVFSDNFDPDGIVPIARIESTKLLRRGVSEEPSPLAWKKGKDALFVNLPSKERQLVAGSCQFGVVRGSAADPVLVAFHARALLGAKRQENVPCRLGGAARCPFVEIHPELPLEIIPVGPPFRPENDSIPLLVLWQGKPLSGVEVTVIGAKVTLRHSGNLKTAKTDPDGMVFIDVESEAKGLVGIHVRHRETRAGEFDGRKFKQVEHHSTLVFPVEAKKRIQKRT